MDTSSLTLHNQGQNIADVLSRAGNRHHLKQGKALDNLNNSICPFRLAGRKHH
jgi:hypothetical protein